MEGLPDQPPTPSHSGSWLGGREFDLGNLAGGLGCFKVIVVAVESCPAGEQAVRKQADIRVVVLNRLVVAPPLDGDAVLRTGELVLQAKKVLVGLELRGAFDQRQ